ncbi:MAG: hypothetical protein AB7E70_21025 [Hyphomicrobiaceae bacterium]
MDFNSLAKNCTVEYVGTAVSAANNTDDNSSIVDTADCEGVMFIAPITDSVAGGVATLTIEQNTVNSGSGMAAIAGSAVAGTSGTNDDLNGKVLITEVIRPRERYVQAVRTSATQNIAFGDLVAVKFGHRKVPSTDHADVITKASVTSPAEA